MHLLPAYLVVVTVSKVTSSRPLLCDACATSQTDVEFSISCKIGRRTEIFRKISKQLSAETKSAIFADFSTRAADTVNPGIVDIPRFHPYRHADEDTRESQYLPETDITARFSDFVPNIARNQDGVERFSDFETQRFLWHSVGGYRESSFERIRDLEHRGVEQMTRNRRCRADNLRPRAKPEPEKRK
jgi:hypothetical protein